MFSTILQTTKILNHWLQKPLYMIIFNNKILHGYLQNDIYIHIKDFFIQDDLIYIYIAHLILIVRRPV